MHSVLHRPQVVPHRSAGVEEETRRSRWRHSNVRRQGRDGTFVDIAKDDRDGKRRHTTKPIASCARQHELPPRHRLEVQSSRVVNFNVPVSATNGTITYVHVE